MPENPRLGGCLDQIDMDFVEREAAPPLLVKLGIQLYLAGLSLSNTVSFLEVFGVERVRSTVHTWVHKADLQSKDGRCPDHVAVDETVIQLGDEWYWLSAAVGTNPNDLLHRKLQPTRTNAIAHAFYHELWEKHDVDDAVFLTDDATPLNEVCRRHGLDFRDDRHGNSNRIERVFREIIRRTICFSNCFSHTEAETADDWLKSLDVAWNRFIRTLPQYQAKSLRPRTLWSVPWPKRTFRNVSSKA